MINAGIRPVDMGNQDFFGNALEDGHPDIGIYEKPSSGATPNINEMREKEQKYEKESDKALIKFLEINKKHI